MRNLLSRLRKNRVTALFLGFFLIGVGLILAIPGVPGPGLPIVFLGIVVLSEHYHWARRVRTWVERKWEKVWHRGRGTPAEDRPSANPSAPPGIKH